MCRSLAVLQPFGPRSTIRAAVHQPQLPCSSLLQPLRSGASGKPPQALLRPTPGCLTVLLQRADSCHRSTPACGSRSAHCSVESVESVERSCPWGWPRRRAAPAPTRGPLRPCCRRTGWPAPRPGLLPRRRRSGLRWRTGWARRCRACRRPGRSGSPCSSQRCRAWTTQAWPKTLLRRWPLAEQSRPRKRG